MSLSVRAHVTKHVTMHLFPSGLVAQLSTEHENFPPPPFIEYDEKKYSSHTIRLDLHPCNDNVNVDLPTLAGAVYLRDAFEFEFVLDKSSPPVKFTLFEMTEDMKSFAAYRLANWTVRVLTAPLE
jgi:hypothetical protein